MLKLAQTKRMLPFLVTDSCKNREGGRRQYSYGIYHVCWCHQISSGLAESPLNSVSARFRVNSTGKCKPYKSTFFRYAWYMALEVKNLFSENSLRCRVRKSVTKLYIWLSLIQKSAWHFFNKYVQIYFLSYWFNTYGNKITFELIIYRP